MPEVLRGVAEGDDDALSELYGNIWHQGTVYEATAYAVPFLVELLGVPDADAGGLLGLLSVIADGSSYADVHDGVHLEHELGRVRAARVAVAGGAPVYLRLLTEGTEDVRAWAAHTLGVSVEASDPAMPAMRERLEREDSPLVRASLVFATGDTSWIDDPDPLPRLAAALVAARTPGNPSAGVVAVIERDALPSLGGLAKLPWSVLGSDPLAWVIECLGDRWELQVRLLRTWMRDDDAEVRKGAVFAAEDPLQSWRPAAARLVPALAECLADPERGVRYWAAGHLAALGRSAADAADALWALVQREPVEHNTPSASALTALCRLRDPRAAGYLAGRLSARPVDLSGLNTAIGLLGPWAESCREPLARLIPDAPAGNDRIAVIGAVGRLYEGTDAAHDVVRALRRERRSHPHVTTRVLGDLGPAAAGARSALRPMLRHDEPVVRANAARALWRISSDLDAALPVLRAVIDEGGYGRSHALAAVGEMGPDGAGLVDLLPALLGSDDEWTALRAAAAYWYVTRDAAPALPILLDHLTAGPRGLEAARCLGDIGPQAADAVPALRKGAESEACQLGTGFSGSWMADDEAWADACADALARITSRTPAS